MCSRWFFCLALVLGTSAVSATSAEAHIYRVLHTFSGAPDGAAPQAGLLLDRTGLYGTTYEGGASNGGTVFKIDRAGNESVLYRFSGSAGPLAGLIGDSAGNLYGTTFEGGANGMGRVFRLNMNGSETDLHSFAGPDGANPRAGLVRDLAGNLYGTTELGGDLSCTPPPHNYGCGTVFKLTAAGRERWLYDFAGGIADGFQAYSGLVTGAQGELFGTTLEGGSGGCNGQGCGIVFKVNSQTGRQAVLYRFPASRGEAFPSSVIRDASGNLYGTTGSGGTFPLYGTVFKLDSSGHESVLYSFTGGTDGGNPAAGLIRDSMGNLYGTTEFGGDSACRLEGFSGCGTIFKLDSAGRETVLYAFTGGPDGAHPVAGLVMDSAGDLYGTASHGGDRNCFNGLGCGVVFKLKP